MREDPPAELIDLLSRLKLADGAAIRSVTGRAKALAAGLLLFPTVWVDALAQARRITPYQAAQINAGRGAELLIGPFVATHAPRSLGYAVCQRVRALEGGQQVELLIARPAADRAEECLRRLTELVEKLAKVDSPAVLRAEQAGQTDKRQWIALPASDGQPLAQWILQNGRLSGEVVLEIARQTAAALATLERAGLLHGDLSAAALRVSRDGTVSLAWSGARAIWRPEEGWAQASDMPLEAYDYLAPERAADRAATSTATDLYAWGLLMWHLATGRVPLPGGDGLAKLRAAGRGKINDVRRLAPETPPPLADAIRVCTQRDPQERPRSFAELAAKLDQATPAGKRLLARTVTSGRQNWRSTPRGLPDSPQLKQAALWSAAAACLTLVFLVARPWRGGREVSVIKPAPKSAAITRSITPKRGLVVPAVAHDSAEASHVARTSGSQVVGLEQTAEYEEMPVQSPGRAASSDAPPPLVLPASKPLATARWQLQAGQTVRSQPGSRAMVLVPPGGLIVAAEDVRFENIDFAWAQSPRTIADPENLAIIDLRAARATFQGCTFQAVSLEQFGSPVAIRWSGPRAGDANGELARSGRVRMTGCVLSGVAAGIDCRMDAPLAVQISDTLHLGPGPLLAMTRPPRADEPRAIALDHATLRGARALLELHGDLRGESPSDSPAGESGNIAITAAECAFAPGKGALLLTTGDGNAKRLIRSIEWSGQGSLLQTGAAVAAQSPEVGGKIEPLEAADLAIDGLVASRIEFAGPADSGVASSRVVRWQAPLESADPPGIDAALPALPPLRNLAH